MREMAESLARGAPATRSCAEVTRRLEARSVVSSTLTLLYHHRNTLAALAPSLHPRGVRFSISGCFSGSRFALAINMARGGIFGALKGMDAFGKVSSDPFVQRVGL